jgi:DNA-binding SARP family transcriptional activator
MAAEPASTTIPTTQLSLLGGFELSRAGEAGTLPRAAQRLVAFLALQRKPAQRGFVAGCLWLDASEHRANASLRTALWRAHTAADNLVLATRTHLSITPAVHVDVGDVSRCAEHALHDVGVPSRRDLVCLMRAGELLPDWYDEWLVIERERLRQLRLLALEALCGRFSRCGGHSAATQAGIAAVAAEPLRESAHRALIRAHLAQGNSAEAIRQYRLLAGLLHRKLRLSPTPETRALITRNLRVIRT